MAKKPGDGRVPKGCLAREVPGATCQRPDCDCATYAEAYFDECMELKAEIERLRSVIAENEAP